MDFSRIAQSWEKHELGIWSVVGKTKEATLAYLHKAAWKNKFTRTPQEADYHLNIIKQKLDFGPLDVSALTFEKKKKNTSMSKCR